MVTLKINNSTSQIIELTVGQFKQLSDILSYEVDPQAAYFSGSYTRKRSLMSKRGEFPTGLLPYVDTFVRDLAREGQILGWKKEDARVIPKSDPSWLFPIPLPYDPYPEQFEAAEYAARFHRGIICAPTGSGKATIILMLIIRLRVPTLVVVPTLELKRQLGEFLLQYLGPKAPVAVQNVDALDPNIELKHVGMVILDEFHHSAAKTYRELNKRAWKNVYYRFGLSATPFRSNDNERLLLESVLSQVIYEISYKCAVDKGYIVPLEAYTLAVPKTTIKGNSKDYRVVYDELIVNNFNRNTTISDSLRSLSIIGVPTLCLVKEIKHGQILSDLTGIPFANGQDGNSTDLIRQFNEGEITALIGTSGVLGEGVDTKPAEYVLLASTGKAKTQFMQNVGRVLRRHKNKPSGKVVLFKDDSHKYLTNHYKQCMIYLKEEYGVLPVYL